MLFIDDDEPQIFQRRKNGAARAHHNSRPARVNFMPFVVPFAFRQMAVENSDCILGIGETALETFDGLRSQRYLGHEHNRRPPPRQGRVNRLEINFRFSAASHSMEQDRLRFLR